MPSFLFATSHDARVRIYTKVVSIVGGIKLRESSRVRNRNYIRVQQVRVGIVHL
jgi:hypothetical protein